MKRAVITFLMYCLLFLLLFAILCLYSDIKRQVRWIREHQDTYQQTYPR